MNENWKLCQCSICHRPFTSKMDLNRHEKWHLGIRRFSCSDCEYSFNNITEREIHIKKVHERGQLDKQLPVHQDRKTFICHLCKVFYIKRDSYQKHYQDMHEEKIELNCEYCGKCCVTRSEWRRHCLALHKVECCSNCCKSFTNALHYKTHIEMNQKEKALFPCNGCCKTCSTEKDLYFHNLQEHEPRRPYLCNDCGMFFTNPIYLKRHKSATHEHIKNFICNDCNKPFSAKADLKLHWTRFHSTIQNEGRNIRNTPGFICNNNYKPYYRIPTQFICDFCQKSFQNNLSLRKHIFNEHNIKTPKTSYEVQYIKVYSECKIENKFVCACCNEGFRYRGSFKGHLKNPGVSFVPGKRRHQIRKKPQLHCSTCDYYTSKKSTLLSHEQLHLRESGRFVCDTCGNTYLFQFGLAKHIREHHQENHPAPQSP